MSDDYTSQRVFTPLRPLDFQGRLLASASTERSDSTRWTILALYRTDAPGHQYILQKIGESVVFHKLGSTCSRRAQFSMLDDLSEQAEPCETCWPDDTVRMPNAVLMEQADYGIVKCPNPEAVEKALTRRRKDRDTGMEESYLSYPARQILYGAARVDDGIAELIQ